MNKRLGNALIAALTIGSLALAQNQYATIQDLGKGYTGSKANGLSDTGLVAGGAFNESEDGLLERHQQLVFQRVAVYATVSQGKL